MSGFNVLHEQVVQLVQDEVGSDGDGLRGLVDGGDVFDSLSRINMEGRGVNHGKDKFGRSFVERYRGISITKYLCVLRKRMGYEYRSAFEIYGIR